MKIKIKSEQIFEDRKECEEHTCEAEMRYLENETQLTFTEKYEQQELDFKITILNNKVIINRQNQTMILDYEKDDNCILETPYGSMNMTVHTQDIQIEKKEKLIQKIILKYNIILQNQMQYDNIITINIL